MTQTTREIIQRLKYSIRTLQEEIHRAETIDELALLQTVSETLQTQLKEAVLSLAKQQALLWNPIINTQSQKPPPLALRLLQTNADQVRRAEDNSR